MTERFSLKYSFDVYNLTNHPSFDIPIDNVYAELAFQLDSLARATCSSLREYVPGYRQLGGSLQRRISLCLPYRSRSNHENDWQLAADSDVAKPFVLNKI